MNGKKLAQKLRSEDLLLIQKENNDYWVSNTYFAVKLNNYDFNDFMSKYNSYKSTESIRELPEKGQVLDFNYGSFEIKDKTPVTNVINGLNNLKSAVLTNIIIKNDKTYSRLYQVNNEIGFIENDYNWLLDIASYKETLAEKLLSPLVFKNAAGEINMIIMPLRTEKEIFDNELNKLEYQAKNEKIEKENIPVENENKTKIKRNLDRLQCKKWNKKSEKEEVKELEPEKEIIIKRNGKYYLYGVELSRTLAKKYKNNNKFKVITKDKKQKDNNKKTAVCTENEESQFAILSKNELDKIKNINFKKDRIRYNNNKNHHYIVKFNSNSDFNNAKRQVS